LIREQILNFGLSVKHKAKHLISSILIIVSGNWHNRGDCLTLLCHQI